MSKKQVAVIGLGRFGSSVAGTLHALGHDVLGIDSNPELVEIHATEVTHALAADCTDEESLRALGLRNFDTVVVAIGHDVQASILATVLLKEIGVPKVIVKAASDLHGRTLTKVGADKVISPERDMGARVAHSLVTGSMVDYIELSPEYTIMELAAPESLHGMSIRDLNLRARFGINVLAVKSGGEINAAPHASDTINPGDILVLLGSNDGVRRLERKLQEN